MTLVKMHVVNALRSALADVKDKDIKACHIFRISNTDTKQPDEPLNSSFQMSLFYVKFQNLGASLKPLIQELESRCAGHREYGYIKRII